MQDRCLMSLESLHYCIVIRGFEKVFLLFGKAKGARPPLAGNVWIGLRLTKLQVPLSKFKENKFWEESDFGLKWRMCSISVRIPWRLQEKAKFVSTDPSSKKEKFTFHARENSPKVPRMVKEKLLGGAIGKEGRRRMFYRHSTRILQDFI